MHTLSCMYTHIHTYTHTKLAIIIVIERLSLMFEGTHSWSQIMSGIKQNRKYFPKYREEKIKKEMGTQILSSLSLSSCIN